MILGDRGPGPLQGPRRAIPAGRGFYPRCRNVCRCSKWGPNGWHNDGDQIPPDSLELCWYLTRNWVALSESSAKWLKPRFQGPAQNFRKKFAGFYSGVKHLPGIELPAGNLGLAVKGKAVGEARPGQDKGLKKIEHFELFEIYGMQLANNNCHTPNDRFPMPWPSDQLWQAREDSEESDFAFIGLVDSSAAHTAAWQMLGFHQRFRKKTRWRQLSYCIVYIFVQEPATSPNEKKTTIGFKIPLFQMAARNNQKVWNAGAQSIPLQRHAIVGISWSSWILSAK